MCKSFLTNHSTLGEVQIDLDTVQVSKRGVTVDVTQTQNPQGNKVPQTVSIDDFKAHLKGFYLKKFNEKITPAILKIYSKRQKTQRNPGRKIGNGRTPLPSTV